MKLQLNKLMAGLVMAGSVVAMVGCGGGGTPDLVVKTNSVSGISKDAAAVTTAKVLVEAASGVTFTLPSALTFTKVSAAADATAPASSVLEVTKKADATGTEIANFKLSSGTDAVTGVIEGGSCRFRVNSATGVFASNWVVGQTYVQNPCSITLPVTNTTVGTTVAVLPSLTLGTVVIPAGNGKTVTVTVTAGSNNTANITVGNSVINVTPLPTGTVS